MKKSIPLALIFVLAAPLAAQAGERLIPAGALLQCTVSEPRLSSQTATVGDPVLCQAGYGRYSRFSLPYDSFLVGRFADYKDPGHFVGKGWMELEFDHIVIEPDTIIPINAKVVDVPGYRIDREGRILGKGHPVRDTVEWMIPVLWPIDLLNLPRRGPRPTLKAETRLTLKVMDDFAVPNINPLQQDSSGLVHRQPSAYVEPRETAPQPIPMAAAPEPPAVEPPQYAQPAAMPVYRSYRPAYIPAARWAAPPPARPFYVLPNGAVWPPPMVIVYGNGYSYSVYQPY